MNSFLRRLKYYGIGFGIGLIFVFFFFQNRGCSWLPDNRVKNSILDRVLVLNEAEQKELKRIGMTNEDLLNVLNDGDVHFNKSKKEGNPQVYVLEKEIKGKNRKFLFTLPKESFISEVYITKQNSTAISNSTKGTAQMIHFPKDENLVYCDTIARLTCQQEKAGLINPKDILKAMKKDGFIDFSKSNFKASPKVEHYVYFIHKNDTIGSQSIWYQNKININELVLPFENNCD